MDRKKQKHRDTEHTNNLKIINQCTVLGDLDDFIFYGEPIKKCSER